MKKKIICISIIGIFLLTSISSFSAIGETAEKQTKTIDMDATNLKAESNIGGNFAVMKQGIIDSLIKDEIGSYPRVPQSMPYESYFKFDCLSVKEYDVDKQNETLLPKQEIKTASVDEITVDVADLLIEGTGGKEYNDCHVNLNAYPYCITIPHGGEITVTLDAYWDIQADQNNWLGEWQEIWYFSFGVDLPNGDQIEKEMQRDDIMLLDDSGEGVMSITFTADESFVGKELFSDLWAVHGRKNWFVPEDYFFVGHAVIGWTIDFELENDAPNKPSMPDGPTSGEAGVEYTYSTSATDPDGDDVYYMFYWDDGTYSDWLGPYVSGVTKSAKHVWNEQDTYRIKVKSKDTYGAESEWSDPLSVTMPRNRAIQRPFFDFLQNHPILYQLLQRLLKL